LVLTHRMDDQVELALQRYFAAEQELEAARWALLEAANARDHRKPVRGQDHHASMLRDQAISDAAEPGVAAEWAS
jgi:hypothetical protein